MTREDEGNLFMYDALMFSMSVLLTHNQEGANFLYRKARELEEDLKTRGIPTHCDGFWGYFETEELYEAHL